MPSHTKDGAARSLRHPRANRRQEAEPAYGSHPIIEGCRATISTDTGGELEERNKANETSLGIIRPRRITRVRVQRKPESDYQEWHAKEQQVMAQGRLFYKPRPIDYPDLRFLVGWECRDQRCRGHEFSFLDWGLHEFSRKLLDEEDRIDQVEAQMRKNLDSDREIFLMLGNFRGHMRQFGLMGVLSTKRQAQPLLFS